MGKDSSVTPKATLSLKNVGPGFGLGNVGKGVVTTFKTKRGGLAASLALSDQTLTPPSFGDLKKMKDVVLTADYKLNKGGITANSKYELGPKKYTVGATWDGKLMDKTTMIKGFYSNKDNLVAGEATIACFLCSNNKANVTFNQKQPLSAKYTLTKGTYTVEPSYSFPKKSPAIALTKKVGKADSLKLAYDVKSEGTSLEYNHKPFKLTVATAVGKSLKFARPTISAVFENTYAF